MNRQARRGAKLARSGPVTGGERVASGQVAADRPVTSDGREFPDYPRVGVGGVVVNNGRVLLIRRGQEPLKGKWSLPGGLVEVGENLTQALRRELKEETGLNVEPLEVIGVFERILLNEGRLTRPRRVRYHYVLIDYACRLRQRRHSARRAQRPRPASDVTAACWVRPERLAQYRLTAQARAVILEALRLFNAAE
jgi:8-oxo-dGTP diphosphatase